MQILNIAGYKFFPLDDLFTLRQHFLMECHQRQLKGTILLSVEGINLNLAGTVTDITSFQVTLAQDTRFADMRFHVSYSEFLPFKTLKIKLKKEIITLRKSEASPSPKNQAPSITAHVFKQWLDEAREMTLLDARNAYEVKFGTFVGATHLNIKHFNEFPYSIDKIDKNKPVVMFCTGGIRCEKAALYLLNQNFNAVFQLEGGILGYFAKVGGMHYQGECFVFDERISLDSCLRDTATLPDCSYQGLGKTDLLIA